MGKQLLNGAVKVGMRVGHQTFTRYRYGTVVAVVALGSKPRWADGRVRVRWEAPLILGEAESEEMTGALDEVT